MAKRRVELHVVPDEAASDLIIVGAAEGGGPGRIPVIPTTRANRFWRCLGHPAASETRSGDDAG